MNLNNKIKETIDSALREMHMSPTLKDSIQRKISSRGKKHIRPMIAMGAACLCIVLAVTALAANAVQNYTMEFYLRYLSIEKMAVADAEAQQYGPDIYLKGLESDDIYEQYFSINKLVEYYNEESIRQKAVKAISPFLDNPEQKLKQAASLALSILNKTYDNPNIYHLDEEVKIFTLFPDYSDYGSHNEIWMIKDGILSKFYSFQEPNMYITSIIPSPDGKLFAVSTCSNKSSYLVIFDSARTTVSPELIDSARLRLAQDRQLTVWERIDHENYTGLNPKDISWLSNDILSFQADLSYNGAEIVIPAAVTYHFSSKQLTIEELAE